MRLALSAVWWAIGFTWGVLLSDGPPTLLLAALILSAVALGSLLAVMYR